MPAYDRSFDPPAAVADVVIGHPVTGLRSGTLRGKLDSGADITVVPERMVTDLGMSSKGRIWTRSYDGSYSQRSLFYMRLTVEGFELPAVRCIATERSDVLLGRNVLNRFIITLDGKSLTFDLKDP